MKHKYINQLVNVIGAVSFMALFIIASSDLPELLALFFIN